jgi:DNA-binding LacI/PurR family transcriptional regulator/DNA-binding transcriptional regulator YhcF (GntR family)
MEKRKPGIDKALAFLKNGLAASQFGQKLPPLRLLARNAQVSFVTMWKAVNQLKKDSIITVSMGGRAIMPDPNGPWGLKRTAASETEIPVESGTENVFWQKVRNQLKKDILSGRYAHGQTLPSCKELMYHHGVSFRTLKKSLDALMTEGLIKPFKRGFLVPTITISESHARVVVLGCGWKDGKIWADYQDKSYFRQLESECIQSKIALDVVVYYRQDDRLSFIHSATKKTYDFSNDNIIGVIYIAANLEISPDDVLQELSEIKKPIAVLDVVGYYYSSSQVFSGNRYIQLFTTTASAFPATLVSRYLLSLKHKRIAFISPFHRAFWSKIRCKNCAAVYRHAGFPDGVRPFVLDRYAYQWEYLQNTGNREGQDLLTLINQYKQGKEFAHSDFFKKFGNISYSISKYLTEWSCASVEIYKRMRILCGKALQDKSITAWLMANDFAATLALDYLKEKNVRVPEDISIIAFDNTLDAMEYQFTSYDFNNNGIVTMMLRYILSPSSIPVAQRGKIVDVEGRIVVRRSTAPARTA